MSPQELAQKMAMSKKVNAMFVEYDTDGSGFLEEAEIKAALGELKPNATKAALHMVYGLLMTYGDKNGDGKLDSAEFINAHNKVSPRKAGPVLARIRAHARERAGSSRYTSPVIALSLGT